MSKKRPPAIDPRFKDCATCTHYSLGNVAKACRDCESGENYEEDIPDLDPSESELLRAFSPGVKNDDY